VSSSSPPPAAGDREGVVDVPYFVLASAKLVVLFATPTPSPDLPIEEVIKFLNAPNMMAASTRVSRLTCCKRMFLVFQMF
jgi:hypothetical protein